jgi:hypothetical protein
MCFETTKSAKARIAKIDIECWKFINDDNTNCFSHLTGRRKVTYKESRKMKLIGLPDSLERDSSVSKGYHSYVSVAVAKQARKWLNFNMFKIQVLKKFIIPAGTRYFENKTEYVSETIMML